MTNAPEKSNRRSFITAGSGALALTVASPTFATLGGKTSSSSDQETIDIAERSFPAGEQVYRTKPPSRPQWPSNVKMVVVVTVHIDGPSVTVGGKRNPLGSSGEGYYSIRAGVRRHLEVLASEGVKGTWMVPGYDALLAPGLFKEVFEAGHELCMHGYYHQHGEGKAADLERTFKILGDLTGVAPKGFCSPGGAKDRSTIAVLQKLGCTYDASEKDDDVPYFAPIDGVVQDNIVILPNNTTTIDDAPMYYSGEQEQEEVFAQWASELEAVYATTGYYQLTYHTVAGWGSGTPDRAWNVAGALIRKARSLPGIRFMKMHELADYCIRHPEEFRLKVGDNSA